MFMAARELFEDVIFLDPQLVNAHLIAGGVRQNSF